MPNRWIEFVKSWAKKMNVSYGCALSDPKLKLAYRKAYPTKAMTKLNETKERFKMSGEDIQSRMAQQLEKETKETETMGAEDRNVAYKKPISSEKRYNRITDNKLKEYNKLKEEYNRVREEARKTKDANLIKKAKKLKAEAEQLATEITEPKQMGAEDRNVALSKASFLSKAESPKQSNLKPELEPVEAKEKRKEKEKERVMEALYRSIKDLIYDDKMSLSDALLTMFPDMQLTTQKLHSIPQILENGKYTGKILLYYQPSIEKIDWFMEYVNKILRGNFAGINKTKYQATYRYLNDTLGARESRMFEMGEEDTRSRSKREYLKPPFNKFYLGEEVLYYGDRANIIKQTANGVRLKPKGEGRKGEGKSYIVKDNYDITKLIEETGK